MFTISENTELTTQLIQKLISSFILNQLPTIEKWKKYYAGDHAIRHKTYKDTSKPCNRIVTNFPKIITDTYSGYLVGKPISYTCPVEISDVQAIINYNDVGAEDNEWLSNALITGRGYELFWLDEYSQVRFSQIDPTMGFPIYSNSVEKKLLAFVRWFKLNTIDNDDTRYQVEVSDPFKTTIYECFGLEGVLEFREEREHYFKDVPVSVFWLNNRNENIFSSIIDLCDAYNELQSSEIDDFCAWVDAYLTLTGVDADHDSIAKMKEQRVLVLPENSKAEWLTKSVSDTQINNMLDNIKKNIFKVTACPDMADETFLAQSGTALAYKLVGFENSASNIATQFKKALQRRIELICNILNLKSSELMWRDIQINMTRNIPIDMQSIINMVNSLKGTVSDETLLAQIPFISDVQAELEKVQEQKLNNMELYTFNKVDDEDE